MREGFKKRLGKTFAFSKKTANLFIASLVIIFLPPLVIAFLYSVDAQQVVIRTPWSAGEMLGYCGTMGAAFIALLGIVYGIVDAWDQQRTQSRMSAAPYFSMIMLTQKIGKVGYRCCSNVGVILKNLLLLIQGLIANPKSITRLKNAIPTC